MTDTLWHYTCVHGRAALGKGGTLVPAALQRPDIADVVNPAARALMEMVWATDLCPPDPYALGLTAATIQCDRTAFRYAVPAAAFLHWGRVRHNVHPALVNALELAYMAEPAHWWVAWGPVEGAVLSPWGDGPERGA